MTHKWIFEKMKNQKILITGGLGFIGGSLVNLLKDDNHIIVVDNLARNHGFHSKIIKDHKNVKILNLDVSKKEDVDRMQDIDFDYIVHAAAIAGIYTVDKKPTLTLKTNTLGTINLLDFALKQNNLKRFLDFSTSEVFGDQSHTCDETSKASIGPIGQDRWGYAASKLIGEYFSNAYFKEYGLKTVTIRPANIYGGSQFGEGAIGNFVWNALQNKDILIHGSGEQVRTWCHIDDFVQGLMLCLTKNEAIGETFNIGNDTQLITIKDLAIKCVDLLDSKSNIVHTKPLSADINNRIVSSNKIKTLLGYDAKVNLEQGILETASAYRNLIGIA